MKIPTNTPLRRPPDDYCPTGASRWFQIPDGLDAGKRLFYIDHSTGGAAADRTVLFVHGNPECSYTYRDSRDALIASDAALRIVIPDHIGFGLSDQADFEMVDMHHAANLAQLIEHLDLQRVTLVVHDWGGPIGIGSFSGMMERVERLVVLNTTIFPMPPDGIRYNNWPARWMPWSVFPHFMPDSTWGGVAAAVLEDANPQPFTRLALRSARMQWQFLRRGIPERTANHVFSEQFRSLANARSSQRNVLQTPAWGHGYRYTDARHGTQDNHAFYATLQQALPANWGPTGRNIPVSGHFGAWDPCAKPSVIQQWRKALPRLDEDLHLYPDTGHFVEESKGEAIAASILATRHPG